MGSKISKEGIVSASGSTVNRNMMYTVPLTYASGSYNAYVINLNENMVAGQKYTLQIWDADVSHSAKTADQLSIAFYWGGGMNIEAQFYIPTGHTDYMAKTFTAQNAASTSDATKTVLYAWNSPGNADGTRNMRIGKWKLEKGEVATPFTLAPLYCPYDTTIYTEPDGSQWIRIIHEGNPTNNTLFSSGNTFTVSVYISTAFWFYGSICDQLKDSWELMVKQKTTESATEAKYRWIQYANPMSCVYSDVITSKVTKITTSGYSNNTSYGGIFKKNSSTYLAADNSTSGSNWFGAFGCWTAYNGGIPGWAGETVTTGYMDLYLRIDTTLTNPSNNHGLCESNLYPGKIGNDWIQANEFIEI